MKNKILLFLTLASLLLVPIALAQDAGTETPAPDAEETPVEDAPADEIPVEETTTEETPVEEAPVEGEPAPAEGETIPAEETPVDEAPAEETPVEEAPVDEVTNGNLEETLIEEVTEEEAEVIEQEAAAEAETISPNLPGGFSRFLSGFGDLFASKPAKAQRALERARENKLRILAKMNEKQTGLAKSKKWAPEMQKLQEMIAADMAKAETAIEGIDGDSPEDLEQISEINEELAEQEVVDGLIAEEAQETVGASEDLSSEEIEVLNEVDDNLEATTEKVKGKAKKELLETAGELVAKGKSIKELKETKDKAVKHKELRAESKAKGGPKAVEKETVTMEKTSGKKSDSDGATSKGGGKASSKEGGKGKK